MATFLLVEEAAELLRCDESTIRRYVKAGRLTAHRPGHRLLISRTSVDELVRASTVQPAARPAPRPRAPRQRTSPTGVVSFRERAKARNG